MTAVVPELSVEAGVPVVCAGPRRLHAALRPLGARHAADLDAATRRLEPGSDAVVVASAAVLGPDPAHRVGELLRGWPEVTLVVAHDGTLLDPAAVVGAGAQDVLEAYDLEPPGLQARLHAALVRRRLLRAAERRARRHELLHANAAEGFAVLDADGRVIDGGGRFVDTSPPLARALGAAPADRARLIDHVPPHERARVVAVFEAVAATPGATAELETEVRAGGRREWVEVTLCNLTREESVGGIVANYWGITARKEAERAVAFNAALLDAVGQAVVAVDGEATVRYWNPAATALYGWTAAEAVGRPAGDLFGGAGELFGTDGRPRAAEILARLRQGIAWSGELVVQRRDGRRFPAWVSTTPFYDDAGAFAGVIGVSSDITERKEAELRFATAFEQSPIGMVVADLEGRPTAVNPAICRMLGRPAAQLLGQRWVSYGAPGEEPLGVAVHRALATGGSSVTEERRYLRPDGSEVWAEVHVTQVRDTLGAPLYFMAQMQDVTGRKDAQAQLTHQALHDELTGLPNRAVLNRELDAALAAGAASGRRVGVAFIDLDGFKHVNDALGHVVGDQLLVQVGDRLAGTVRPGDTVARFGGDEYVLVCHDVTEATMLVLTEAMSAVMTAPYVVGERVVDLHASIGITVSRDTSSTHSLLSEADAAMYRAKDLGRDRTVVFDDSLRDRSAEMLESKHALRAALANDELAVYYQPIVALPEERPVGVEALVRWHSADGRVFMPGEFIPTAEASGLIVRLGAWVLERAATEISQWNAADPSRTPLWVSVNLSARQLAESELPAVVASVLERSSLPPELLHLEITETVVMHDVAGSIAVLEELKGLGVQLSIDDFGTGHSSLAYLRQLPVDVLKIDRSFVRDLGSGASIVEAVLSLGAALRMRCVAEGVETAEQRAALVSLGCPLGQGYLWSRPLPADDARRWLQAVRGPGRRAPAAR